jgi:hypothetical protein
MAARIFKAGNEPLTNSLRAKVACKFARSKKTGAGSSVTFWQERLVALGGYEWN